jgi:uncharacterized UBP type Zn finger protein
MLVSFSCHFTDSHQPYSWDTWPHDEERAKCGYVGLTNLGATCYMATCMQHLYMIPEARKSVIEAQVGLLACQSSILNIFMQRGFDSLCMVSCSKSGS